MSSVRWSVATTESGREYYYNPTTKQTSWEWHDWMEGSQPPPPPPPPATNLQKLEDFAYSCGWNGLCIKKDYKVKLWPNGHKGGAYFDRDRTIEFLPDIRYKSMHEQWFKPENHEKGKPYVDEPITDIDCRIFLKYFYSQHYGGCSEYPLLCFKSEPDNARSYNKEKDFENYFPKPFYPCPTCYPQYWKAAMVRNKISVEHAKDVQSKLGMINGLGLVSNNSGLNLRAWNPLLGLDKYTIQASSPMVGIVSLYDLIKKQEKRIKDLENILEATKKEK
jgi:hypothetical protein